MLEVKSKCSEYKNGSDYIQSIATHLMHMSPRIYKGNVHAVWDVFTCGQLAIFTNTYKYINSHIHLAMRLLWKVPTQFFHHKFYEVKFNYKIIKLMYYD